MGCGASKEPIGPAPGAAQFVTPQTTAPSSSAVKSKAGQGAIDKDSAKAPPPSFAALMAGDNDRAVTQGGVAAAIVKRKYRILCLHSRNLFFLSPLVFTKPSAIRALIMATA